MSRTVLRLVSVAPLGSRSVRSSASLYGPNPLRRMMSAVNKPGDPRMGTLATNDHTGNVVIVGFPWDEGCIRNGGRKGAAGGPAAFRTWWPKLGTVSNQEYFINLKNIHVGDAGDVDPEAHSSLESAHEALQAKVEAVLASGAIPFIVGGSNDQSFPNAAALMKQKKGEVVSVINIDAHLDVRPLLGEGQAHSGSPFRLLLESPEFKGRFTEFAAQGSQCSAAHAGYVTDKGGRIIWLSEVTGIATARPVDRSLTPTTVADTDTVAEAFQRVLDDSPGHIFVSFDIDSIRASDCPGTSAPGAIGLTAENALRMSYLAGLHPRVAMMDVSEMNPAVEGFLTPRLVAYMFYHFLLGLAGRKGGPGSPRSPRK